MYLLSTHNRTDPNWERHAVVITFKYELEVLLCSDIYLKYTGKDYYLKILVVRLIQ